MSAKYRPLAASLLSSVDAHSAQQASASRIVALSWALLAGACDVTIETSPPLFPAFDPSVRDYVVRCDDKPVQVSVLGMGHGGARIDGQTVHTGKSTQIALTSGQSFSLQIPFTPGANSFSVRCLPSDFPQFSTERPASPQAEWYIATPGLTFSPAPPAGTSNQYIAVFDNQGVPVWWRKALANNQPIIASILPNGHLIWLHNVGSSEERRLDGSLVRMPTTVAQNVDNHEIQLTPRGTYVVGRYVSVADVDLSSCGGPPSATVVDNELQELSLDGEVLWSWRALDHIPVSEAIWPNICSASTEERDIYHLNSIEPDGDAFIVSLRHTNAVYKISRSTGDILWKLGGSPRSESLSVTGDALPAAGGLLFGGQHDARRLEDGSLTVHDNRTGQQVAKPRALHFQLDETAMTATMIEAVSDADVTDSRCCGSARKLRTGNWVTAWGANPSITELTELGALVFRIKFADGLFTHRAVPLLPGRLSRLALRAGMDVQYPRAAVPVTVFATDDAGASDAE